jgi:agmatine deiminase
MTKTIVLFILLLISINLFCQSETSETALSHSLSPEEELQMETIARDFVETAPPAGIIRNIAEFEPMQGVLIRYSFGISLAVIAELSEDDIVYTLVSGQSQENTVTSLYNSNGVNISNCLFIHAATDSYWTRDYGPLFVTYGDDEIGIVNFPYNRPRPNDNDVPLEVAAYLGIDVFGMNVIHTGGNYMTDGMGISASSDLVLEENPGLTSDQVDSLMQAYLNIDNYHKIPDPNNTYIDHIDCWSKFLDVDKILIRSVPSYHAQYGEIEGVVDYFEAQTSSYGTPYQIFRVYTPSNQPYTNSLILNRKVYVPVTGSSWDDDALTVYETAMPGYEVLGFTGTWESTDALHCRAKGVADTGMLYIQHFPVITEVAADATCSIDAEIIPYSGSMLISDSLKVYYRINAGSWSSLPLTANSRSSYSAQIPAQSENDLVEYYIHAVDSSGRKSDHPYIGKFDPHSYSIAPYISTLLIEPDSLYFQLPPDSSDSGLIRISNTGVEETSYTIEIDPVYPGIE